MEITDDEQQQIEALKRFWKKYSNVILYAVLIASLSVLGIRYYRHHKEVVASEASDSYALMISYFKQNDKQSAISKADYIIKKYKKTPYAGHANLLLAKLDIDDNKINMAKSRLKDVISTSKQDHIKHQAKFRLIRIYLHQDEFDNALNLIEASDFGAYAFKYLDLKGDVLAKKKEFAKAKEAYIEALAKATDGVSVNLVELKLNDLTD